MTYVKDLPLLEYISKVFPYLLQEVLKENYNVKAIAEHLIDLHYDKVDQYLDAWKNKGLDTNRCSLLYLLSFTTEYPSNLPRHKVSGWVADSYLKYNTKAKQSEINYNKSVALNHMKLTTKRIQMNIKK